MYCGEQKASVHVAVIVPEGPDRAIDDWGFLPFAHYTANPPLYMLADFSIDLYIILYCHYSLAVML
jgi:hypothetical protein